MFEEVSAVLQYTVPVAEHGLKGGGAEADQDLRSKSLQFGLEPGSACNHLGGGWLLVYAAFAALFELEVLYRVGDVNVGSVDAGIGERTVQESTRRPDERPAGAVLLVAGLLAKHDDGGAGAALAEDGLGGMPVKVATVARLYGI